MTGGTFRLYGYFRSSAAYRVRIALNLKGIAYENVPVHLLRDGGEQHRAAYRATNPQGLVPALEHDGRVLTQSLAIVEYLEEIQPEPALLPRDPLVRAQARAIALAIACDIHPLNNLRVLNYLRDAMRQDEAARAAWYRHWIETGLAAVETMAARAGGGPFCLGGAPTMADLCLVPQLANARRYDSAIAGFTRLLEAEKACLALPAFAAAAPERQGDAT